MRRVVILTVSFLVALSLHAQRVTNEQPYGLRSNFIRAKIQETTMLSAPDMTRIEREDKYNDMHSGLLRYAYPVWVNFTPENSGTWHELDNGSRLWQLKVNIPGALATAAFFDQFWLPEGGKFFVYSEETGQSVGAIISEFIDSSREKPIEFATTLIHGETVVFEYYQPAYVEELPIISINRIDYGYRNVNNQCFGFGCADPCHVNINCPEGNNWRREQHAITRISIPMRSGSYWCSGALINNTANDFTPYVLTADHCMIDPFNGQRMYGAESGAFGGLWGPNASGWRFYWGYEHPGCNNSTQEPSPLRVSIGATVVANRDFSTSDFALLRILPAQDPRNISGVTPFYLGWDRSGNPGTGGVGIHHPGGDVKKISTYTMTPQSTRRGRPPETYQFGRYYWRVVWAPTTHQGVRRHGVTQVSSSGSPLINNNGRVIGQLWGGRSYCVNMFDDRGRLRGGPNEPDWYGKFSVSWTGGSTMAIPHPNIHQRLDHWLDPRGTNPQTLNGILWIPPPPPPPSISGNTLICNAPEVFTLRNFPADVPTIRWSVIGPFTLSSTIGNPVTVTKTGFGEGVLTAYGGGRELARITLHNQDFALTHQEISWTEIANCNLYIESVTVRSGDSEMTLGALDNVFVNGLIVRSGAELTLKAGSTAYLSNITVQNGARLIIDAADLIVEGSFDIEAGAELDIR